MEHSPDQHQDSIHSRNWWHIHVDGTRLGSEFEKRLQDLGFWPDHFIRGSGRYAPEKHMTWKGTLREAPIFRINMNKIRSFLLERGFSPYIDEQPPKILIGGDPDLFTGYIEGEGIPIDESLIDKPFNHSIQPPFKINMKQLESGFRESEVHISMDADASDKRLIDQLHQMGFYDVLMPKPKEKRTAIILTAQVATREEIMNLLPTLRKYLIGAGGTVKGSLKIEHIADWIASGPNIEMPPVIGNVEYL